MMITLSLSDLLAIKKGGYSHLKPWENWLAYETDIREIIQSVVTSGMRIDYWDIWSEPDTVAMWSGSCEQAMDMFHGTSVIIHTMCAISIDIESDPFNKSYAEVSMQEISKPRFSWRVKKEPTAFKQVRIPINNGRLMLGDCDAWIIKLDAAK